MSISNLQENYVGQAKNQAGNYLWIALPLVLGTVLAQSLPNYGIPVLYPFIRNEFDLSHAQVGLMTSSVSVGMTAVILLAGWLTDYLGVKRVISISLLGLTTLTLSFPLAYSFPVILVLLILIGISISPLYPATTAAIMDWFPSRIRALVMSIKQTGLPIGGALTAAILPALTGVLGWRMAAAATGLLVIFVAITFMLLYRDVPRSKEAVYRLNFNTLKSIFLNRGIVTTIVWGSIFVGFQFIVISYFMLFMIEELGLSAIIAGGLLAIAQVSSIISRVLWGAASDFAFHGRRLAVLSIIGFITVAWMISISLMSLKIPSIFVYLLAIIIGISTISFHGVFNTLIGELAEPGQVGVTLGVTGTTMQVSRMLIPPLFGHLVDMSGSYSFGWIAAAAVAFIFTVALLIFGREPKQR